ncbi:hypothetical protein [Sandaracinus amylolyticus]|nr:hypothetical protein [Sandaracinus amylolyticus]
MTSTTNDADQLLALAKLDAVRAIEHVRASLPCISSAGARSLLREAEDLFGLLDGVATCTSLAELASDERDRYAHAADARGLARSAYLEAIRRVELARSSEGVRVLRFT